MVRFNYILLADTEPARANGWPMAPNAHKAHAKIASITPAPPKHSSHSGSLALVVLGCAVLALGGVAAWKPRFRRFLSDPDIPGGLGASAGLMIALYPRFATSYQTFFIVLTALLVVWFVAGMWLKFTRDEKRIITRLSHEAADWSNFLYGLCGDCIATEFELDRLHGEPEMNKEYNEARGRLESQYDTMRSAYREKCRFKIGRYLDELKEAEISYPKELRELIDRFDRSLDPSALEIEKVAAYLEKIWQESYGARRPKWRRTHEAV